MGYSEKDGQVVLTMSREDAIALLMRIHYGVFMANPRFWYEKDLREADTLICVAASDLRRGNPHYTPYQVGEKK
jgi:hypothetical protein